MNAVVKYRFKDELELNEIKKSIQKQNEIMKRGNEQGKVVISIISQVCI